MYNGTEQQDLISALLEAGIDYKSGNFVDSNMPMFYCPDVVWKLFPDLKYKTDNKGLIDTKELELSFELYSKKLISISSAGYFRSLDGPFAIMAHPFMRRGMSRCNNFLPMFLPIFLCPREKWEGCTIKLQLDADCIMLKKDVQELIERERMWGPRFTEDISKIKPGVARHSQKHGVYPNVTEYYWKEKKGGVFQLEIEELDDEATKLLEEELYGCKYLHSEYDRKLKRFVHFDGAVRKYTKQQLEERKLVAINKAGSDQAYTKLFRIDGNIPFLKWKQLISMYLIDNETVNEYFCGEEEIKQ